LPRQAGEAAGDHLDPLGADRATTADLIILPSALSTTLPVASAPSYLCNVLTCVSLSPYCATGFFHPCPRHPAMRRASSAPGCAASVSPDTRRWFGTGLQRLPSRERGSVVCRESSTRPAVMARLCDGRRSPLLRRSFDASTGRTPRRETPRRGSRSRPAARAGSGGPDAQYPGSGSGRYPVARIPRDLRRSRSRRPRLGRRARALLYFVRQVCSRAAPSAQFLRASARVP